MTRDAFARAGVRKGARLEEKPFSGSPRLYYCPFKKDKYVAYILPGRTNARSHTPENHRRARRAHTRVHAARCSHPRYRDKAIAVIGMRRAGKTTLLWQILRDRLAQGTQREGLLYFGFEDERLAGMTVADLGLIVEEYYQLHPEWRDGRRAVFFLDEIQTVPGWEVFARRLLETEKIDLFLSGSSARLLSREVATSMRGRAMEALAPSIQFPRIPPIFRP